MPSASYLVRPPPRRASRPARGLLYPLDYAYAAVGIARPSARLVAPEDIPQPYRALLAHEEEMTHTLEEHFGAALGIRPLWVASRGSWYSRRVLLVLEESGRPVAMGAIRLALESFEAPVRARILQSDVPLGRVLRGGRAECLSRPRAFVAVTPHAEMMGVFWMREPHALYGRQTEVTLGGAKVGHIVEILRLV